MKKILIVFVAIVLLMVVSPMVLADDFDDAEYISFNSWEYGEFKDNNTYYFSLSKAGKIEIDFETDISSVSCYLYDKNKKGVIYDSIVSNYEVKNNILYLTSGEYYIKFRNATMSPRSGEYKFKCQYTSGNESFTEEQNGDNNNLASADNISLNQYYIGYMAMNDTNDYYRFSLNKDGKIEINFETDLGCVYYTLYDKNKAKVEYGTIVSSYEVETVILYLTYGEYYIQFKKEPMSPTYGEYKFAISTNSSAPSPTPTKSKVTTTMSTSTVYLKEGETFNFSGTVDTTSSKGLDDIQINLTKANNPGYGIKFFRTENVGSKSYNLSNVKGNLATKNYITAGDIISGYDEGENYVSCKLEPGTSWYVRIFATDNEGSYMEGEWVEKLIVIEKGDCNHPIASGEARNYQYHCIVGDDTYHRVTYYLDMVCGKCGKTTETNIYQGDEKYFHNFSGNKCTDCGYTKSSVDTTPPSISLSVSPNKTTFTGETVTFTANVSDNKSLNNVEFLLDGVWISGKWLSGTSATYTASVSTAELTDGTHHLVAYTHDRDGNENSKTYTFTKSATAPFPATSSDYSWASQYQIDFLNLVNTYRSWYGAAPLKLDANAVLASDELARYNLGGTSYDFGAVTDKYYLGACKGFRYNGYTNCNNAQNLFTEHMLEYADYIIDPKYTKLGVALTYYHPSKPYWYFIYVE